MHSCIWKPITTPELWQLADSTGDVYKSCNPKPTLYGCLLGCLHEPAVTVGALQGTIVYNPDEPWSLATVVTLCGVHRALPVAARQHPLTAHAPQETGWLRSFFRALLRLAMPCLAQHDSTNLHPDPLLPGGHIAQNIILDTRGMWTDSHEATSWAYKHLFTSCSHTHETIAIQVQNSRRCVAYVPVAAILPYSRGLTMRHSPAVGCWPVHVYPHIHLDGQHTLHAAESITRSSRTAVTLLCICISHKGVCGRANWDTRGNHNLLHFSFSQSPPHGWDY